MAETFGIGIIGCGFMGTLHARALSQLANAHILACADPALKSPPALPEQDRVPELYSDYRELLVRDDVDAVVIATPEYAHREAVQAAAERGKHILLEKPIATTLEDADAIIEAASRYGIKLMMAHVLRFDARYAQIKAAVDAGKELGRRLSAGHDRTKVAAKMQQQMTEKYKEST